MHCEIKSKYSNKTVDYLNGAFCYEQNSSQKVPLFNQVHCLLPRNYFHAAVSVC